MPLSDEDTPPNVAAITLRRISKSFGRVRANRQVSLEVAAGDIHGIIGENGAGKSTLVSILYGFYTADSGEMQVYGKPYAPSNPSDALRAGIGMVHQHFMLVPNFTVLENIVLATDSTHKKSGLTIQSLQARKDEVKSEVSKLQAQYDLDLPLDAITGDLPVGLQQRVEILKALHGKARILILDEPTAVLTPQETNRLFHILAVLKKKGMTILLITHKLNEIMATTDRVSVMRHGEMLTHLKTKATSKDHLARVMLGYEEDADKLAEVTFTSKPKQQTKHTPSHKQHTPASLKVKDLTLNDGTDKPIIHPLNFQVKGGEIFGITGVAGNGQTELLELLAGLTPPSGGQIIYDIGKTDSAPKNAQENDNANINPHALNHLTISHDHPGEVSALKQLGVAHIPEDRQASGLILPFSAAESAILGYSDRFANAWLPPHALHQHCHQLMQDFDIRPHNSHTLSRQFSGGNQQKLVLARELTARPRFLLIGQPTRGVDIGAIAFIHRKLLSLREAGVAIILVSVELEEILALADRIMVMHAGHNMGIMAKDAATITDIGLKMAGVGTNASQTSPQISPETPQGIS